MFHAIERRDLNDALRRSLAPDLCALVSPSYEDPTELVRGELQHCNQIYLGLGGAGEVLAFFMVGWDTLEVGNRNVQTVYLGLSGEGADHGASNVGEIYAMFDRDAFRREESQEDDLIMWGTTLAPSVVRVIGAIFQHPGPTSAGNYQESNVPIFEALRSVHYPAAKRREDDPPFVLRGIAQVRYSEAERQRIARIEEKHGFHLFRDLELEDQHGDRVLFVCRPRGAG